MQLDASIVDACGMLIGRIRLDCITLVNDICRTSCDNHRAANALMSIVMVMRYDFVLCNEERMKACRQRFVT
jgi:hypothetical protein